MNYNTWIETNYDDLDYLYYTLLNYIRDVKKRPKIMDKLTKEDFFYFIYTNTDK